MKGEFSCPSCRDLRPRPSVCQADGRGSSGSPLQRDGQRRNRTLTGHSRHENPFGQIYVRGIGGVLKFKVQALDGTWESDGALEDRLSLDLSYANVAYWLGNRESTTFEIRTNLANGDAPAVSQ